MVKLYNYQIDTLWKVVRFKYKSLLVLDPGLGKTIISLELIKREPEKLKPVLVVVPASIKYNWQREANSHYKWPVVILDGKKAYTNRVVGKSVVVINYDILKDWVDAIKVANFKTIIFDECQYLCNPDSLRSKAAKEISIDIPHIIGLSGTPLMNRPSELWSILNIIRPDLYPSYFKFKMRYCDPKKAAWGWNFSGSSNLDELNKRLISEVMVRKRKSDVLTDLPDKVRQVVLLELKNKKEYDYALKDFKRWMKERNPDKLQSAEKAEQLVKIGYLKRLAAELKLPVAIDWIDDFLQQTDEKLIVFAIHTNIIESLQTKYGKLCVVVNGQLTSKNKDKNFEAFKKDKKIRLLIGNIRSAGVGWSAKGISSSVFVEQDFNPAIHIQAEDRTHGISRGVEGEKSFCYYLVSRGTIEEKLTRILQTKQEIINKTLDGTNSDSDSLDIYDMLTQELMKDNE